MSRTKLYVVPHIHWDREWYRTFEDFRGLLVERCEEILAAKLPHFLLDGQAVILEDLAEVRPELAEALRRGIGRGAMECGPWYVLADECLVSGECLVRNLEAGRAALPRAMAVGYMPDSFGHPRQMPQILKGFGIERAVLWRGVSPQNARAPFLWRSPDGSEVAAIPIPGGYYHDPQTADLEKLAAEAAKENPLLLFGGDHLAPPTAEQCRALQVGSLDGYRPKVSKTVVEGDLRDGRIGAVLPGTLSTRAPLKALHDEVRDLLVAYLEPAAALADADERARAELAQLWKLLLLNEPHDSICGCSIDEVHEEMAVRLRALRDRGLHALRRICGRAAGEVAALEPFARERSAPVFVTSFVRKEETADPADVVERRERVALDEKGFPREGAWVERVESVPEQARKPQPPWLRTDEKAPLGFAPHLPSYPKLRITLEDEADLGDSYNFEPARDGVGQPLAPQTLSHRRVLASYDTPKVRGFRSLWSDGGPPNLDAEVRILEVAGSDLARVRIAVRNARENHRLRCVISPGRPAPSFVAGMPFDAVERKAGALHDAAVGAEQPSTTHPFQGFVIFAGLAVYARGLHEAELRQDGSLAITLLRCVGQLGKVGLVSRPFGAGPPMPVPGAQCFGVHTFELGVRAVPAEERLNATASAGDAVLLPPLLVEGARTPQMRLRLEGDPIVVSSLRPLHQGERVELRVVNLEEEEVNFRAVLPWPIEAVEETRLDGSKVRSLRTPRSREGVFEARVPAHRAATFSIARAARGK
ncbi:MAG: hypothetical protein JNJ88_18930 [Planctomycetes bacterium]|nr:hypothetical protein [Planctomycetota bacterium]